MIEQQDDFARCTAVKRDGGRCNGPATKSSGRTRCPRHGGATPPPLPAPEPPKPAPPREWWGAWCPPCKTSHTFGECPRGEPAPSLRETVRESPKRIRPLGVRSRTLEARHAVAVERAREERQVKPALMCRTRCKHCRTTFERRIGEGSVLCPQCGKGT